MKRFIVTVGAPRSGKDTWADEFIKSRKVFGEIWEKTNRDEIRRDLFGFSKWSEYKFTKGKEATISACQFAQLECYAEEGANIICSDTNINEKTRAKFEKWASDNGYTFEMKQFDVPLHILEERNADAPFGVAPKVIVDMWLRYQTQFNQSRYQPLEDKPKAVIFDMDGTLAIMDGRHPFEFDKVLDDLPNRPVIDYCKMCIANNIKIIVFTGRSAVAKDDTLLWLDRQGIAVDEFFIRSDDDSRPDHIVKKEMFDMVRDRYHVTHAVDDRDQVVNLWRSLNIPCWQVNYGKF
ncbi:putative polynucleotide 5'-kinase and 3'-phosphatase [Alishewanella phage vB_AspM_Slicko01]|nr:putative polynucleotide 5'-kinase and 3'-phosphatase [Alishewanella phage vB_AspM_Slicko01]